MTQLINYQKEYTTKSKIWPIGISAGAVVYKIENDRIKILLLIRNKDSGTPSYNLPKGTLHIDETLEDCAVREVKEEAGVDIELVTYLGGSNNTYLYNEIECNKIFHYYAGKYIKDSSEMDSEHEDRIWLDIDEAKIKCQDSEPDKNEMLMIERLEKFVNSSII